MYKGIERRKFPRIPANFVVSYRPEVISGEYDLTQTRNISQGGILFTTKEEFKKGTYLRMLTRLPVTPYKVEKIGQVVDSRHPSKPNGEVGLYETRVQFLKINDESFRVLGEFVKQRLKIV